MKWDAHIRYLEKKLRQACGAIYRLRKFVNVECLNLVYYSHAYTYLNYEILLYGSANKGKLNHLNVLQTKSWKQYVSVHQDQGGNLRHLKCSKKN